MKKRLSTLLVFLIGCIFYSEQLRANRAGKCAVGTPIDSKRLVKNDLKTLPVHIQADKTSLHYPKYAIFSGNVVVKHGNNTLKADEVQLQKELDKNKHSFRTLIATGHVDYYSDEIKLQGPKTWSNLETKDIDVYQGYYQMLGRQGRGNADIIKQRGHNRYTVLENGSFTSCLPGDDSWIVIGSKVIHDREEKVAEIWNARFQIRKTPLFYSPYLQIPVGGKRRSGFLITHAKYGSNNGFEFSVPYYLNLAINYDATITPNYMSKRGIQIQSEFRYLSQVGAGLVELDWLPKDKMYSSEHSSKNDRWLLYWRQNGVMNRVWSFNVDYTKVSDANYLRDLYSTYAHSTDGYTTQKFSFSYPHDNWDIIFSYKHFHVFDVNNRDVYSAAPQLDLTYYKNTAGPFNFKVFGQVVKFSNAKNHAAPEAIRLHIEPTLNFLIANSSGSLNAAAAIMATHYQQENIHYYNNNTSTSHHLTRSVHRILPQFKIDAKMLFERDIDHWINYTQTLEPRLGYLCRLYRNQNDIGVYDSTILETDYLGLFRDRIYSGLDRISSANRLASGITTRIYDDNHMERFNASLGQIYNFSRSRTGDPTSDRNHYGKTGSVVWAGDGYCHISNDWGVRGRFQYDFYLNSVELGNLILEYQSKQNRILQLNYRYASSKYIKQIFSDMNHPGYQQGISQVGLSASLQVAHQWSLVGVYYYDIKANHPSDQQIAFQYNTCCWGVNVGYERKIIGWNQVYNPSISQYDKKISFNIELRGLSSNHGADQDKMLGSGILPHGLLF
ncbi:LPS assembly protein LptD [Candidatus Steffania adelgidicola]|uniref:LPS assembly protein LptD n=1 Tax=Candidatus Steffania adelgidicola TaxID=1076626 RepID=UPI001D008281|nr:LPS assembly protein LptD [Candidatus Steffania adelgidicola]UDG80219.1 LPS-assembly protein LptD [Candidatus Steffania adelgidicola]